MANSGSFPLLTGDNAGRKTASAGTAIVLGIPSRKEAFTRLMKLVYTTTGTAHSLACMRVLGRTTTSADAAASQAVINITANPGPSGNSLAANDYVCFRTDAGLYVFDTVSSISTLAVTLSTNLSLALTAGADVWMFGIYTDTDPKTGVAHPLFSNAATATDRTHNEDLIGVCCSHEQDEPLLLYSTNGTNAGVIEMAVYAHTKYGRK